MSPPETTREQSGLQRLAAALVSRPFVYDLVQNLVGQKRIAARLRTALPPLPRGRLLDVGSSAAAFARRLKMEPVCLDLDVRALSAARRRGRASRLVGGDAARLPFPDGAFDVTLCVAVSHHLDDVTFHAAIAEFARVTAGHLVFLDAVRQDRRRLSRWLWRYDRGSCPRSAEALLQAIRAEFNPSRIEEFSQYHRYLLCIAKPRSSPGSLNGDTKLSAR